MPSLLAALPMRFFVFAALLVLISGCRTVAPPPPPPPIEVVERTPAERPLTLDSLGVDLADKPPQEPAVPPGIFESQSHYPQTAITEWRLANGVRVAFKSTPFESRTVHLRVLAPDGLRSIPDSLSALALLGAPSSGGFTLDLTSSVSLWRSAWTTPLLDERLRDAVSMLRQGTRPGPVRPITVDDALTLLLEGDAFPLRGGGLPSGNPYTALFDDPRSLLVLVVGDASRTDVERAVVALAGLRPSRRSILGSSADEPPARIPDRVTEVVLGPGRIATAGMAFRGRLDTDFGTRAGLDVLGHVVKSSVEDRLDAEVQTTVSVETRTGVAELRITAVGEEVTADRLRDAVLRVIGSLRDEAPTASVLSRARADARMSYTNALASNSGWADWMATVLGPDLDSREILAYGRRLGGVPPSRVLALSRALLDADRYVLAVQPAE